VQTDAELVEAVLRGDQASFAPLVERHERAVMGTVLAVLPDHAAAQDVAQDAFVTAYQQLATLRSGTRFGPWVISIARHRARRVARRRAKQHYVSMPLDSLVGGNGNGQSDELLEELFGAMSRLSERQRRFVLLRYFDGLSVNEVAEATGRPVGTVTKYLSRAHKRLRELLKDTQT